MCCEQTLTPLLRHIDCVLTSTTAGAKLDESFVYKESEMHHSRVQPAQLRAVLLLFLIFFNDSGKTICLKIYRTDLRRSFRIGRTMVVDYQSEISFSVPRETLPWQPIFVGFSARVSLGAGG